MVKTILEPWLAKWKAAEELRAIAKIEALKHPYGPPSSDGHSSFGPPVYAARKGLCGNGDSAGLHHPAYNFNDEALVFGTSYWIKLVENTLAA